MSHERLDHTDECFAQHQDGQLDCICGAFAEQRLEAGHAEPETPTHEVEDSDGLRQALTESFEKLDKRYGNAWRDVVRSMLAQPSSQAGEPLTAQQFYAVWVKEHGDDPRGDWPIRFADAFAKASSSQAQAGTAGTLGTCDSKWHRYDGQHAKNSICINWTPTCGTAGTPTDGHTCDTPNYTDGPCYACAKEKLLEWVLERYENCKRIAKLKSGNDKQGWLEDADYFLLILAVLREGVAALAKARSEGAEAMRERAAQIAENKFADDKYLPFNTGREIGAAIRALSLEMPDTEKKS